MDDGIEMYVKKVSRFVDGTVCLSEIEIREGRSLASQMNKGVSSASPGQVRTLFPHTPGRPRLLCAPWFLLPAASSSSGCDPPTGISALPLNGTRPTALEGA